jgi:DNA-binding MarR family transcriptional regulator
MPAFPAVPAGKNTLTKPASKPPLDKQTPAGHLHAAALNGVLGYQLAQAAVTTSAVFAQVVGAPHDLRTVEYTVLQLITENPGCSSVQLAKALAVTKPNITQWVDRLVARRWVERKPSSSDKRAFELRATKTGQTLAQTATRLLVAGEAAALDALSAGERTILAELLHKVSRSPARHHRP